MFILYLYFMILPWLYDDYTMFIQCLYHEYTMLIPCLYHVDTMLIPCLHHDYQHVYSITFLCYVYTNIIMFLRCVYTMFIPTITQWTCHLPHSAPLRWWAIVISSPSDAGGNDMFQGRGQLRLPCVVDLPRCPDVPSPLPWGMKMDEMRPENPGDSWMMWLGFIGFADFPYCG